MENDAVWVKYHQMYRALKGSILPVQKYLWGSAGVPSFTRMIEPGVYDLFTVRVLNHYGWVEFLNPNGECTTFRFIIIPGQYIPPCPPMEGISRVAYIRGEVYGCG